MKIKRRNYIPKKKPATNSGMFSNSGAGQKMDRAPKRDAATKRVLAEINAPRRSIKPL